MSVPVVEVPKVVVVNEETVHVIGVAIQGPPGPAGALGGDAFYTHNQSTPAATWNVAHNLSKKPAVTVVDSTERVVYGEIVYVDSNNLTLTFTGAFSGKAYLV